MDPKDINLYIEKHEGDAPDRTQQDADSRDTATALEDAANALSGAARVLGRSPTVDRPTGGQKTASISSLSYESKMRVHSKLQSALAEELGRQGSTLGLKPGDLVAISSSVGQSISF